MSQERIGGWASGAYHITCVHCGQQATNCDKRAVSCRSCAETLARILKPELEDANDSCLTLQQQINQPKLLPQNISREDGAKAIFDAYWQSCGSHVGTKIVPDWNSEFSVWKKHWFAAWDRAIALIQEKN